MRKSRCGYTWKNEAGLLHLSYDPKVCQKGWKKNIILFSERDSEE